MPKRVGPYYSSADLNNIIKMLNSEDKRLQTGINSLNGHSGVHTIITLAGIHIITVTNDRITDWDEP